MHRTMVSCMCCCTIWHRVGDGADTTRPPHQKLKAPIPKLSKSSTSSPSLSVTPSVTASTSASPLGSTRRAKSPAASPFGQSSFLSSLPLTDHDKRVISRLASRNGSRNPSRSPSPTREIEEKEQGSKRDSGVLSVTIPETPSVAVPTTLSVPNSGVPSRTASPSPPPASSLDVGTPLPSIDALLSQLGLSNLTKNHLTTGCFHR